MALLPVDEAIAVLDVWFTVAMEEISVLDMDELKTAIVGTTVRVLSVADETSEVGVTVAFTVAVEVVTIG